MEDLPNTAHIQVHEVLAKIEGPSDESFQLVESLRSRVFPMLMPHSSNQHPALHTVLTRLLPRWGPPF